MMKIISRCIVLGFALIGFARAEDVLRLAARLDYTEPVITAHFRVNFELSGLWLVQQETSVHVLNSKGRLETSITAKPEDVVIVSPSQRYFAVLTILPDYTASVANHVLSVRVFHHTGKPLYNAVSPFNPVFDRPQIVLTDNGSLVFAERHGTTIREEYAGTTLNEVDLTRYFSNWRAEAGTWLTAVSPDQGYFVATTSVDSITPQPVVQVAVLSNRLHLLSQYQFPGRLNQLFPATGQGHAWLGFESHDQSRLALLGRDSVITFSATVPTGIIPTGDPGRALFKSSKGLQIVNWNDGMLETGYIPQNMDKVIAAAFLPGIEGYLILYGRQCLRDNEIQYENLLLHLVNKTGNVWFEQSVHGEMTFPPAIVLIDQSTAALKTDHHIYIYQTPSQSDQPK